MHEKRTIPSTFPYPFGKGGYSIGSTWPKKQVLKNSEIRKIIALKDFKNAEQEYARDIWLFLYRANGINFADLLRMRWDNIKGIIWYSSVRKPRTPERITLSRSLLH